MAGPHGGAIARPVLLSSLAVPVAPVMSAMPAAAFPPAYAPVAPVMPAMPAAAPPPAYAPVAALSGSSFSVPTSRSSSSVEVRGPGLLGTGLARLGERLTEFGRTRIRTVQETVVETPRNQPVGGTTTISTSSLTPGKLRRPHHPRLRRPHRRPLRPSHPAHRRSANTASRSTRGSITGWTTTEDVLQTPGR